MIVWVWHCPKCGRPDAIYFDESEAGTYDQPDACERCGYAGDFAMYEISEEEAVESGWMRESQYESPYIDDRAYEYDDEEAPESYGYAWGMRL